MNLFSMIAFTALLALTLAAYRRSRPATAGLLLAEGADDDSDMKIVGGPTPPTPPDQTAEELEQHRRCGNLAKAYALSAELAKKIIDEDGGTSFGADQSESCEVRTQRRLLLAFVVDYCADSMLDCGILKQAVINRFYDILKQDVPNFYEDIRESASFSFYFLCIRNAGSVDQCIGKSFAMLAGCEGDAVMAELGQALFLHFKDIVESAIDSVQFVKL